MCSESEGFTRKTEDTHWSKRGDLCVVLSRSAQKNGGKPCLLSCLAERHVFNRCLVVLSAVVITTLSPRRIDSKGKLWAISRKRNSEPTTVEERLSVHHA